MPEATMTHALKILLVEDDELAARAVQAALAKVDTPGPALALEWVSNLELAIARLDQSHFDAILLDLHLPDSHGPETLAKIVPHRRGAALVVWTASEDHALATAALREGAEEFVVKGDLSGSALARRLRLAVERQHIKLAEKLKSQQAVVMGFAGAKGGVGTTTIALNAAAVLARQNHRTIVIELKPSLGTLSYQLKYNPPSNLSSFRSLGAERIDKAAVAERLCSLPLGIRVLFGPQQVEEFGDLDPKAVEALIVSASRLADCVIIDLPPTSSAMAQAAIRQCHFVLMVLEREPVSVPPAKMYLRLVESWGYSRSLTGAVIVNRSNSVNPMSIQVMAAQIGCDVIGGVPPAVELCAKADEAGSPALLLQPESFYARAVEEVTRNLFEQASVNAASRAE